MSLELDWPTADDLKLLIDMQNTSGSGSAEASDWDTHLEILMDAGIDHVKQSIGRWDGDTDVVTPKLHMAALRAAIVIRANGPMAQPGGQRHQDVEADPEYQGLMMGMRRRFGIA